MKKLALTIATLATLAAVAAAPAEARGVRVRSSVAAATAAAIAADVYLNGYGYYGATPLYYGAPVYGGYRVWHYY
jgi:hypothetical protein